MSYLAYFREVDGLDEAWGAIVRRRHDAARASFVVAVQALADATNKAYRIATLDDGFTYWPASKEPDMYDMLADLVVPGGDK